MKLIGLTGYAQSGKDTAAAFLTKRGWTRLSFADALRDSLYALNPIVEGIETNRQHFLRVQTIVNRDGWDRAKVEYPEIRQLLQRFGTEVGRALYGENFWVDRVEAKMEKVPLAIHSSNPWEIVGNYVISDVRFPNEAKFVHKLGGKVWRINRAGTGAVNSHVSDTGIDSLTIDGVIPNTGTLEQFEKLVLEAAGVDLD